MNKKYLIETMSNVLIDNVPAYNLLSYTTRLSKFYTSVGIIIKYKNAQELIMIY